MRILVAPQEFKGTLNAAEAAAAIVEGIESVHPEFEVDVLPLADGGLGTVDVLLAAQTDGEKQPLAVKGPLGVPVTALWATCRGGTTAMMEMAAASGITLLGDGPRDVLRASTWGTGELIRAALDAGCRRILVGAGGSATNDGGTGAAAALGVRFLDRDGSDLPLGPQALTRLASIDLSGRDARLSAVSLEVLVDVRNALLGEEGCSAVYGPQKGATPDDVEVLDAALERLVLIAKRDTGLSLEAVNGAGAAGGLAYGLATFLGATIRRGFDVVAEAHGLFMRVQNVDVVITGEGRIDGQTAYDKGPYALGRVGRMQKRRVVIFTGSVQAPAVLTREAFDDVVIVGGSDGVVPLPAAARAELRTAARAWAQTFSFRPSVA